MVSFALEPDTTTPPLVLEPAVRGVATERIIFSNVRLPCMFRCRALRGWYMVYDPVLLNETGAPRYVYGLLLSEVSIIVLFAWTLTAVVVAVTPASSTVAVIIYGTPVGQALTASCSQ